MVCVGRRRSIGRRRGSRRDWHGQSNALANLLHIDGYGTGLEIADRVNRRDIQWLRAEDFEKADGHW